MKVNVIYMSVFWRNRIRKSDMFNLGKIGKNNLLSTMLDCVMLSKKQVYIINHDIIFGMWVNRNLLWKYNLKKQFEINVSLLLLFSHSNKVIYFPYFPSKFVSLK